MCRCAGCISPRNNSSVFTTSMFVMASQNYHKQWELAIYICTLIALRILFTFVYTTALWQAYCVTRIQFTLVEESKGKIEEWREERKDSRDRMEDDCVKDGSEAHHKVDMWLMTLFPSNLTARFSWKCSFLIPFMLGIPTHRPFSWMPSRPPHAFIFLLEIFATIYSITFFVSVICFSSYDKLLLNL